MEAQFNGRFRRFQAEVLAVGPKILLVGLMISLCSLFIPNQYTSTARVLPRDPKNSSGLNSLAAAAAAFGIGAGVGEDMSASYVDILKSRWVSERLLTLTCDYSLRFWYFGKSKTKRGTLQEYLGAADLDRGDQRIKDVLEIQRDTKSGLITIMATTSSPELSQAVARETVRLLEEFIFSHSQSQASAKADFARGRHRELLEDIAIAEEYFRRFLIINRNYQQSNDPTIRLEGARLEADLNLKRQVATNLALAREQAVLDQKDNTPVLVVLDQGHLPIEKSRPSRALMVVGAMLISGLILVVSRHRKELIEKLMNEERA